MNQHASPEIPNDRRLYLVAEPGPIRRCTYSVKFSHWDLPEILGGPWGSAGHFEPHNSVMLSSDSRSPCKLEAAPRREGRVGLSFLVCTKRSPDEWSMQFIHDQCPQNKMSCEAPRKPAKTHTMTACWRRLGPTLVWPSQAREDQKRSQTDAPALTPCYPGYPASAASLSSRQCQLPLADKGAIPATVRCLPVLSACTVAPQ